MGKYIKRKRKKKKAKGILFSHVGCDDGEGRKVILKAWEVISSKQKERCERAMKRPVKISIFISDLSTLVEKETKRRCRFSPLLRVHCVVLIISSTLIT